jgi:hypothetical protein
MRRREPDLPALNSEAVLDVVQHIVAVAGGVAFTREDHGRHSATISLRAKPTMAMRLPRRPPLRVTRWNQALSALPG